MSLKGHASEVCMTYRDEIILPPEHVVGLRQLLSVQSYGGNGVKPLRNQINL